MVFMSYIDEFNGKFVFLIGGTLFLVVTNFMACVFFTLFWGKGGGIPEMTLS